jgi:hypothetical protein
MKNSIGDGDLDLEVIKNLEDKGDEYFRQFESSISTPDYLAEEKRVMREIKKKADGMMEQIDSTVSMLNSTLVNPNKS